ncbi:MAG: exodeoxyribonuclease VII large subunit [Acutalibacter sp.]|nr:exodeoxyribonuclease VII large subunit [Acutalibacter sp.]
MPSSVLTVSQVNFYLKSMLESDHRLQNIMIAGEISNFTDHYRSGHLYFSLKDEKSVLKAVMFAGSARFLKFKPADGMRVIVRGRISVYEPSGQYQLYAEEMQPDGIGALSIAFEQLKAKLEAEGLFDDSRKRPLPQYPRRIGVITSPTGAAVQDILQITARRWPAAEIVFAPVLVQGDGAPEQLIRAVKDMNRKRACDVILLGRGGGSLEDLWAFNDEGLARAVCASEIPVVSCVGHETDFTICDFVADVRAPTPSAAAELATPDIREEKQRCLSYFGYFQETAKRTVESLRQNMDMLMQNSPLGRPEQLLFPIRQQLEERFGQMKAAMGESLGRDKQSLSLLMGRLDALSPLKVLQRGYAVAADSSGRVLRTTKSFSPGDSFTLRLSDGTVEAKAVTVTESEN